ncbi:hypothetical protein niasHT_014422 [Heterodera trifolii]|uniref:Uncharacterized protein n=1 Tax=Heterodera trifolii TaxID=157864 RepID=A0ABD2LHB8_9BILA
MEVKSNGGEERAGGGHCDQPKKMKRTNERKKREEGRGGGEGGQQFVRANIAADNCHKQQHTLKRKTKEEFVGWKRNDGRIFGGGGEEKREKKREGRRGSRNGGWTTTKDGQRENGEFRAKIAFGRRKKPIKERDAQLMVISETETTTAAASAGACAENSVESKTENSMGRFFVKLFNGMAFPPPTDSSNPNIGEEEGGDMVR